MYPVFYCKEFNEHDLGDGESPLRKKFNAIIEDLEENNSTSQGDIKLIKGDGNIEYFRAKLSDSDRLLFRNIKYNDKDAFVILEVILNHDYHKSKFLTNREKIKNIKIISEEVSDNGSKVDIEDNPQVHWLGKFVTFSAKQEEIVENASNLPLVVSGSAGSGKTSVALEKLRKIEEEFKEGKVLYITKSENLIKKSKELYEYEWCDKAEGEIKAGVPEQIEFLSVHEFLKKIIKEDEKIKGKKPINRSKFFSWFNEMCKRDKFKEYKKDGDKIFEEFTAVIGGGGLLGKDGKDRYAKLGNRQSIFPGNKRESIYDFFKEYREFIEKDSKYYDPNLIAHECVEKVQANYDAIVVDEVQDLTESTLGLILKSLKDESKGNFLLCGDVNQVIHPSFFSVSRLKSFLRKGGGHEIRVCTLEKNYRNSKQVIELANRILHFKNYCFASEDKITEDEKKAFFMKSDTKNTGNVGFIAKDKEQEIAGKVSGSTNWAVLVLNDKSKEDARELFGTPLVFNIQEAKGLEFENVILYKFTSHEAYNKIWNVACSGKGEKANGYCDKDKSEQAMKPGSELKIDTESSPSSQSPQRCSIGESRIPVEKARRRSGKRLQDKKHEQNTNQKEELELLEKNTWELFLALEDRNWQKASNLIIKGVNVNAKNDKDGDTPLHIAAYNGRDDIAQLLLECKADVNEISKDGFTPLHLAAQNGHDSVVELLLQHKADINATTNKNGYVPLHLAAKEGYKRVAQLLLEHGANVDARNNNGNTPLHMAAEEGHEHVAQLLLGNGAKVNAKNQVGITPLHAALGNGRKDVANLLFTDPNINVGCIYYKFVCKEKEDKRKFIVKRMQDEGLFCKVKEAKEKMKKGGELGESLKKELENLLNLESEYDFKPSLNYSPDGSDKNTTIEIAIEAGGKILQLLYDYAEKHIDKNTKVFKQLKHAKEHENTQPRSGFNDVSTPHNLAQAQVSIT